LFGVEAQLFALLTCDVLDVSDLISLAMIYRESKRGANIMF